MVESLQAVVGRIGTKARLKSGSDGPILGMDQQKTNQRFGSYSYPTLANSTANCHFQFYATILECYLLIIIAMNNPCLDRFFQCGHRFDEPEAFSASAVPFWWSLSWRMPYCRRCGCPCQEWTIRGPRQWFFFVGFLLGGSSHLASGL